MKMFGNYLRDMFQLLLSPIKGWEDVETDDYDFRDLYHRGLLPFLVIASLSVLIGLFYFHQASVLVFAEQAVVCFVKFFATYFFALFFFTLYMPLCIEGDLSINKLQTFILYGVGLLALVDIIQNVIPIELSIAYIMPAYCLYVLWRGLRYLTIKFDGTGKFILLILLTIIIPPYLIQFLFNLVIPKI